MKRREKMAQALVDAAYTSDEAAASKHGVTVRTIRRWRDQLQDDPELVTKTATAHQAAQGSWVDTIDGAIQAGIDFLARAAAQANPCDPEAIHAVAGAVKILFEVQMSQQILDARLAARSSSPRSAHRR